mmetsp:Transcript_16030/g.62580  ORF Transcript_16030/g.62580 Transcript_16030/m.62580 type:complete len:153 (-) Transcript_16030:82-540(-)
MEGGNESFFMFLYIMDGEKDTSASNVSDLLEQLPEVGEFEFKSGHCKAFFKALFKVTKIDLMRLVGVSVHDDVDEMEFCNGLLQREEMIAGAERLRMNLETAESRKAAANVASSGDVPLDGLWFIQQATLFLKAMDKAIKRSTTALLMGYFE